jgi:hypothetical protein
MRRKLPKGRLQTSAMVICKMPWDEFQSIRIVIPGVCDDGCAIHLESELYGITSYRKAKKLLKEVIDRLDNIVIQEQD